MRLGEVLEGILPAGTAPEVEVTGAASDSRLVRPGDVFLALKGERFDGREFIGEAAEAGARAALCEEPPGGGGPVPALHVPELRRHLSAIARRLYSPQARGLKVVGVTGTNGKTTVTFLLREALRHLGCGLVGTLEYDLVSSKMKAFLTTPQVVETWRFLAEMRRAGAGFCAMEVSSQGLDTGRVEGVPFAAAVFTNLTRDHLDYHGSMGRYLEAKLGLFRGLDGEAVAVVNLDDPSAEAVLESVPCRSVGTTLGERAGPHPPAGGVYCGRPLSQSAAGMELEITPPGAPPFVLASPLAGRFNAMNLLQAAACAMELGVEPGRVQEAVAGFAGAPGRLQRVDSDRGFAAFVDYAHTPDALERVLETLRPLAEGRLIAVFGCGGDRDRTKRPIMGRIASGKADLVVVTSDNPRTEDPGAIIEEIVSGVEGPAEVVVEPDRRKAIRLAVRRASPGDVVLVAGKGHEDYQEINGVRYPLDDREEVLKALEELADD